MSKHSEFCCWLKCYNNYCCWMNKEYICFYNIFYNTLIITFITNAVSNTQKKLFRVTRASCGKTHPLSQKQKFSIYLKTKLPLRGQWDPAPFAKNLVEILPNSALGNRQTGFGPGNGSCSSPWANFSYCKLWPGNLWRQLI